MSLCPVDSYAVDLAQGDDLSILAVACIETQICGTCDTPNPQRLQEHLLLEDQCT